MSPTGTTPVESDRAQAADEGDQAVDVLRGDAVGDDGARVVVLQVQVQAVLAAGADEVLDKIHAAAGAHPAHVGIGVVRLDDDFVVQEDVAIEREVAKRGEPRGRVYQLVSNYEGHRGAPFSISFAKPPLPATLPATKSAKSAPSLVFCPTDRPFMRVRFTHEHSAQTRSSDHP